MTEPAVLLGGPHDGREVTGAKAKIIETVYVTPERIVIGKPRPPWWRHPILYRRWTPPPPPIPLHSIKLRYTADGSTDHQGRRIFRLTSPWQPYHGPEATTSSYEAIVTAAYAVPPLIRCDSATRWSMSLESWKQCRREAARQTGQETEDEEDWKPSPDDLLMGIRITVTEDGGMPHLENARYPAGWPDA